MDVNATPHLAIEIALNAKAAPEWVQLLPAGPTIVGQDGRSWVLGQASDLVEVFNRDKRAIPIDWEHATQIRGSNGQRADAAGWIEKLEARNGGVWGKVAWTEEGRKSVEGRGYRYLSPVFNFEKATTLIKRLNGAGLVHHPNLSMAALNRVSVVPDLQTEITPMDKSITDALGLVDGASVTQVVTAINAMKASVETATNKANAAPDTDKYVPKADYDLAMNKLEGFQTTAAAALDKEITDVVDAVIATGDPAYPPANRDDYIAMCKAEGGLERFKRVAKPQLERALNNRSDLDTKTVPSGGVLSDEERAVNRQMGVSDEDYLKAKKEMEAAA